MLYYKYKDFFLTINEADDSFKKTKTKKMVIFNHIQKIENHHLSERKLLFESRKRSSKNNPECGIYKFINKNINL